MKKKDTNFFKYRHLFLQLIISVFFVMDLEYISFVQIYMKFDKNLFFSFLSQSFVVLQSIIAMILITRNVIPQDFGVYTLCLTAVGLLNGFIYQPLIQSILVFGQNDSSVLKSINGYIKFSFIPLAMSGFILSIIGYFFQIKILSFIGLISTIFIFDSLRNYILSILNIRKNFKKIAYVNIFGLLKPILSVLLYIFFNTVESMLVATFLAVFINLAIACRSEIIFIIYQNSFSKEVSLKVLNYAKSILPSKLMFWAIQNFDKLSISILFGPTTLGLYAPLYNCLYQIYWFSHSSVTLYFRPYIYEKIGKEQIQIFLRYFLLSLAMFVSIFLITNSNIFLYLLKILIGENYQSLFDQIWAISLLVKLVVFIYIFEMFYLPSNKVRTLWVSQFTFGLILVFSLLFFVPSSLLDFLSRFIYTMIALVVLLTFNPIYNLYFKKYDII
tara:strand:+ start:21224 stop:22552 length:1329 start_codon:yes stop_codon:yes gene_type:complete